MAVLLGPRARERGLWPSGPVNIGQPGDYRVPDQAYLRTRSQKVFVASAAIVVEVLSPHDETHAKFGFYFACGVEDLLVVDPLSATVQWYGRGSEGFEPVDRSTTLGLSATEVHSTIDWPPPD